MSRARVFRCPKGLVTRAARKMDLPKQRAEGYWTWEHRGNCVYLDFYGGLSWVVQGPEVDMNEEGSPVALLCELLLAEGAIELTGDDLPPCPGDNFVSMGKRRYDEVLTPFREQAARVSVESNG
jgi:hypothetical protein